MVDARGGARILLVDDHPDTLQLLAIVLRKHGYAVETAEDAEAALHIARNRPLDLVVSDIHLPDRHGLELMRDLYRTYGLRGIAVTGSAEVEDEAAGADAGFIRYMVKPVLPERLLEAIDNAISSRQS